MREDMVEKSGLEICDVIFMEASLRKPETIGRLLCLQTKRREETRVSYLERRLSLSYFICRDVYVEPKCRLRELNYCREGDR